MKLRAILTSAITSLVLMLAALSAAAQGVPVAKEGTWTAQDFRFHTGEVMPELRLHYRTIGDPAAPPVLVLHGTTGSGASMLGAGFAGELFNPGQPLDAAKYFIILPDGIGHGKSSKPSDGLRAKFPRYNYDDMVLAQYKLVTEGLGCATCGSSSATPWAACMSGCGAWPIPTSWTHWCRWPRNPPRWRAATG